jgi:hypothetical protein
MQQGLLSRGHGWKTWGQRAASGRRRRSAIVAAVGAGNVAACLAKLDYAKDLAAWMMNHDGVA